MGVWGPGSGQNDDAADWLTDFEERPRLALLERAIRRVAGSGPKKYLDITDCAEAIVAADALCLLLGRPGKPAVLDKSSLARASEALHKSSPRELSSLIKQAQAAVDKVLSSETSELEQVWAEDRKGRVAWTRAVRDLLA